MIIFQDDRRIDEVVRNARQTRTGNPRTPGDLGYQQKTSTRNASDRANRGEYLNSNKNLLSYRIFYKPVIEYQFELNTYRTVIILIKKQVQMFIEIRICKTTCKY